MRRTLIRLAVAVIVALGAIALFAVGTGRVHYVVTSGVSMQPTYHENDLVLVQDEDTYSVGDIVAYRSVEKGMIVLHRIVGGDPSAWTIQGDNNQSTDPD